MNAHELLVSDHVALRREAAELEAAIAGNPGQVTELYARFHEHARKHFQREDTIYYPAIDGDERINDRELMHDLRNDHAAVIFALESLAIKLRKNMPVNEWKTKWKMMIDVLLPHLDHEERGLFPRAEKLLSADQMKSLTDQIRKTY